MHEMLSTSSPPGMGGNGSPPSKYTKLSPTHSERTHSPSSSMYGRMENRSEVDLGTTQASPATYDALASSSHPSPSASSYGHTPRIAITTPSPSGYSSPAAYGRSPASRTAVMPSPGNFGGSPLQHEIGTAVFIPSPPSSEQMFRSPDQMQGISPRPGTSPVANPLQSGQGQPGSTPRPYPHQDDLYDADQESRPGTAI